MDWHSGVYKMNEYSEIPNWHEIRKGILKRDSHQCFRCESRNRRELTVHHIIPRNEGGGENSENLITLCSNCHDFVETEGLRSLIEIEASTDHAIKSNEIKKKTKNHPRTETFKRPKWHEYVYGGKRHSEDR